MTGITHSQSTLDYALQHDYIRAGKNADFEDLVREADCIIFGLYPTVLLDWVKQYGQLIRPGTMVTDVSGVKRGVVEPVQAALPEGVEFIASHPMAGRETSGIAHSAEVNFAPANFIITPTEKTLDLLRQYGVDAPIDVIPSGMDIARFSPERHDHQERMDARRECGLPEDKRLLLNIGRIAREKNLDQIMRVFPKLLEVCPDVHFLSLIHI